MSTETEYCGRPMRHAGEHGDWKLWYTEAEDKTLCLMARRHTTTAGLIAQLRRKAEFFKRVTGDGANETELLLRAAADALEETTREMHARELHHFETEQLLANVEAPAHDPRCISLSDSPFAGEGCDCKTLRMLDEGVI